MKNGSLLLGLGIGVLAMSVLFGLLSSGLRGSYEQARVAFALENQMLLEEHDRLAEEIFLLREIAADLGDSDVIERATLLGMTFAPDEYNGYDDGEDSDYDGVQRYYDDDRDPFDALAQIFSDDAPEEVAYEPATTAAPAPTPSPAPVPTPVPAPTPPPAPAAVSVSIPSGSVLQVISSILAEQGVVSDASAFTEYVVEQGAATRMQAGEFTFTPGADFDEIMRTLMQ
ncbi:MAG: hypothetical protein FWD98_04315 [Defluviitaleaceae bacterium]|nr:hypothetical protein [Defluviitaleaceae bacterium]